MSNLPFVVDILEDKHTSLLNAFNSSNSEIDRYLCEEAFENQRNGKGVTYLILNTNKTSVIAYYTISSSVILTSVGNNKISGISAIEILKFAVSVKYQDYLYNTQYGKILFSDLIFGHLLGDIYSMAINTLGIQMIILHSLPKAVTFYERNGMDKLNHYYQALYDDYNKDCIPMYLPLF